MFRLSQRLLAVSLVAALSLPALAQDASDTCPQLPTDGSDLIWADMQAGGLLLCRAIDLDGQEAFAVTVSRDSPFKPQRGLREEQGRFAGAPVWWYRSEIAGRPDELVRETLLEVGRNRVAHVYIRTRDAAQLERYRHVVEGLRFDDAGLAQR